MELTATEFLDPKNLIQFKEGLDTHVDNKTIQGYNSYLKQRVLERLRT